MHSSAHVQRAEQAKNEAPGAGTLSPPLEKQRSHQDPGSLSDGKARSYVSFSWRAQQPLIGKEARTIGRAAANEEEQGLARSHDCNRAGSSMSITALGAGHTD